MKTIDYMPFIKKQIELEKCNYRKPLGWGFVLFAIGEIVLFGVAFYLATLVIA